MTLPRTDLPKTSTKACQCTACNHVFTVVANFDRHRKDSKCLNPLDVGLVVNSSGMWGKPPDANGRFSHSQKRLDKVAHI